MLCTKQPQKEILLGANSLGKKFKKNEKITNLSEEDVLYLSGDNPKHLNVIKDVHPIVEEAVEVKEPVKVEKAVKKTTKRTTKK